ncbi:uncharacterized protein LOC105174958 [Sesamum indicum]|uniref:Uncharacterized protein LOC105174958 n=1 Tax=Sesamum indicum TaxID=4182 RepID=A0A6I9UCB1_SESIN|nr:uncharacterized protein LOC105174958 [Sesamum indicum]
MEEKRVESSKEFMMPSQVKNIIPHLLLSLSLFSFVFSYSSSLLSLHSPNKFPYFSTNNSFLNKNCLFLICNGLLVFLAKTSGTLVPPPPKQVLEKLYVLEEISAHPKQEEEEETKEKSGQGAKDQVSIFIEEEEGGGDLEDERGSCWLFDDEQLYGEEAEEEEEEEEKEEMSTEEMNKKFEDFIRRMKEEIMINEATHNNLLILN